ncbi:MAG: caspase family protein [Acidimicrobiia bacterium]
MEGDPAISNSRSPSHKDSSSSPANDAHVRPAPGGVGAVRRARAARRQKRRNTSFFFSLIALVAAGALGAPAGFSPSPSTDVLAATRLERADRADRSHSRMLSRLLRATEASNLQAESAAAAAPATPVNVDTSAPAHAVDRPIVAPPNFSRTGKAARPPKVLQPTPGPKDGGVWALVVGIDDYPGSDADLSAGTADAREVDSALASYGVPGQHRIMLLDHQATADNIRAGLAWVAGRAASDATIVFFYSGHVRQVTGDADRDGEATDEAIVAADGEAVYDGEVAGIFRNIEARSVWLGIAGCYGSGFDDAVAPGRILTAAATETDLAYENSALGHSYLVEYMVHRAMLQGRAPGSVQESFAWAQSQIAKDYPNRQPVMVDKARSPLVLGSRAQPAGQPTQSASESPAPAEPQPGQSQEPATPPGSPSEPGEGAGACAQVLGVSVCSTNGSSRPNHQTGWRRAV